MKSYGIGEVCRLLDIKPHVLRYWETVVDLLAPGKTAGGRRHYSESDLRLLYRLKHLVVHKGLSPESAGKVVWEERTGSAANLQVISESIRETLVSIREHFAAEADSRSKAMLRVRRLGRPSEFVPRREVRGYTYLDVPFLTRALERLPRLSGAPEPVSWPTVEPSAREAITRACGRGLCVDGSRAADNGDDAVMYLLCAAGVTYLIATSEWTAQLSDFALLMYEASLRVGVCPSIRVYSPPWSAPRVAAAAARFPRGLVRVVEAPVLPVIYDNCPVADQEGRLLVTTGADVMLAAALEGASAAAFEAGGNAGGGSLLYAPEAALLDKPRRLAAQIADYLHRRPAGPVLFCRRLRSHGLYALTGSTIVSPAALSTFAQALVLAPAAPAPLKIGSAGDDRNDTGPMDDKRGEGYHVFRAVLNQRCETGAVLIEEGSA